MKPKCLIVDSDSTHAQALTDIAKACGYEVDCADAESSSLLFSRVAEYDVFFLDLACVSDDDSLSMSDLDLRGGTELFVMAEADDPEVADQVIREGASYFFCKPLEPAALKPLLRDIASEAAPENVAAVSLETCGVDQFGLLRGSSRSMRKLYRHIRKIAQNDVTTMIVGESGTGKELIAQTIHLLSERREGPFSAFNCGAVAANLAESELFGHEKGAFSGATKRHHGHFERADGGTLLLDEITEMNIDLQTKLLRVLETRKLRRLGAEENIDFDVRIICASNRSPEQAVREGTLRADLYYRLSQFPLHVPPLRHRDTDIVGLAQYFLRTLNEQHGTHLTFSEGAIEAIRQYSWPGNVRELQHLVERAYILSDSVVDREIKHAIENQGEELEAVRGDAVTLPVGASVAEAERRLILATLKEMGDDKQAAARVLGVSLKTLYNRLKEYTREDAGEAG